jgi:hypothetical protein
MGSSFSGFRREPVCEDAKPVPEQEENDLFAGLFHTPFPTDSMSA